jgi:GNAT superfamily N-acetyltransferase
MTGMSRNPEAAQLRPDVTIRRVKGFDAPAIAELRALWSTGEPPTWLFTSSIRAWLETEGDPRITLMASADGRPIGMVSMLEYRGMPRPAARSSRWGYIDHLFVRDGERHQGVGTALINETIATADHRDYERLLVSPNGAALSLFHRLGFLILEELGPEGILLLRPPLAAAASSLD